MLTEICNVLKNWFCSGKDKHIGAFAIEGGVLTPSFALRENQYYRIIGSVFNDGVHRFGDPSDVLTDESFEGAVWEMRVPADVIALSDEVAEYMSKYENSPYVSESFGGYSYSKATGPEGAAAGWEDIFASRLNQWRKI